MTTREPDSGNSKGSNGLHAFWRERVPMFLPEWMRRRIEVNVYDQILMMREAQSIFTANSVVIDAGSGEGRYRRFLNHARYVAIDYGVGDETWDYSHLDGIADLHRLPISDQSVDGVVCTQVLEHVRYPEKVIGEMARVLRSGGHLFLSAPQGWHQHQKPHDYFRFTSFALDSMFRSAGLVPQYIRPMGGYFWALSYELQMMHYWLFPPPATGRRRSVFGVLGSLLIRIPFLFLLPLPLYYMDRLDRIKDKSMGYVCHCIKD
jgi:SAM-dependent methyltransferase